AALTAHLSSKTGNELDIFFETADKDHKPVPLPLKRFTATAKTADGGEQVLEFTPAPKDERKDDPDGTCSHFVATASWMKPEDRLKPGLQQQLAACGVPLSPPLQFTHTSGNRLARGCPCP